jgi:hypothetical protein
LVFGKKRMTRDIILDLSIVDFFEIIAKIKKGFEETNPL